MSSNLADLPLDLPADLLPITNILGVKMTSNVADLPLYLPASPDILLSRWVQIWQIYPPKKLSTNCQDAVQIWQIYSYICWDVFGTPSFDI